MFRAAARHWLALVFLAIGLISGLRQVYATPMGQVADEPSHAARAAALLHGAILGSKATRDGIQMAGVRVDAGLGLASIYELHENGNPPLTPRDRALTGEIPWEKRRLFDPATGTVTYFPALYMPGALGIGLGGLVGFGPLQSLYLGRAGMLLAFLALGTASLWLARAGRGIFFTLLSLPMTISLGASFNQDGMIIASCALAGALLTLDPQKYPRARWWAAAIIGVVIGSKPPYGLLLFTAALPIFASGVGRRLILAGLFGLPAIIWLVVMIRTSFVPHVLASYHPGPLWPGNPEIIFTQTDTAAGLRVLLHEPSLIFALPYQYITLYRLGLRTEFIGEMGWLDVLLSSCQYAAWTVAVFAAFAGALFSHASGARRWRASDAAFVLVLIIASIIAICLALYLQWTPVGATLIQGVQGRYFLPLVPFIPLILPRLGALVHGHRWLERGAVFIETLSVLPAVALAGYDIVLLPALVHARFG